MERVNWRGKLGVLLMFGLIIAGCKSVQRGGGSPGAAPVAPAPPSGTAPVANPNTIPEANLLLTRHGIEFAGVDCIGAYTSQVSGVVKNEQGRVTAKTITSTCTTSGDTYVWVYTNRQYNSLGQMTGYNLKLSSSRLGKEYELVCSNIMRDNLWEVVRYQVQLGGETYQFQR